MSVSAPPIPNSYWVIPGRLLAGEYPGSVDAALMSERVRRLLDAGVDHFLNLTMDGELSPYDFELPLEVEHVRMPIRDHGVPEKHEQMVAIVANLQRALNAGRCAYVHCRAGIGRTGTVIGCLLVEHGLSGDAALDELNRLWQACARSAKWTYVPETEEQIEFVRRWRATGTAASVAARAPASAPGDGAPASVAPVARAAKRSRRAARGATIEVIPAAGTSASVADASPAGLSLRDRFLGSLIGLAVGDALAVTTQGCRPGTFAPVSDLTGGGIFDLPRGAWTDDTALALCLAESLLECGGFDSRDQVERFGRWQHEGYLSSTGQCVGITPSTTRALGVAHWRRQMFAGSHDPAQLDPEPLSRVVPVAMYFFPSVVQVMDAAADASRTTCQAPMVLDACQLLSAMLHEALSGAPKTQVLAAPRYEPTGIVSMRIRRMAQGAYRTRPPDRVRAGSTVGEALEAALWVFDRTQNYREAVLLASNLGERSDVVTSVCGALAGAFYGIDAIPRDWRSALISNELISEVASDLAERLT